MIKELRASLRQNSAINTQTRFGKQTQQSRTQKIMRNAERSQRRNAYYEEAAREEMAESNLVK